MKSYILCALLILIPLTAFGQQDDTVKERLIRLEEGQKSLNQRFDDVNKRFDDVNKRFDDVNRRIDDLRSDIDKRFNWLYLLVSAIIALNGAMVGSVVWLARQERPMSKKELQKLIEEETDTIKFDLAELKSRLNRLETVQG
jgi:septal ring factor EnvC (AmiA/AmiB activator)